MRPNHYVLWLKFGGLPCARKPFFTETTIKNDANDLAVTVRFKPPLADRVKRIAGEEGSPFTAVIRHAVAEYVARRSAGEQRASA
jgi:predicted DNA binding CopG/RHH family protein